MKKQEYIFKESGLFWWHDNEVQDYSLEASVAGDLSIRSDGQIDLNLHGMLRGQNAIIDGVFSQKKPLPKKTAIFGVLKGGAGSVLIWELYSNGAHAALTHGNFSYQAFGAYRCLLGDENIKQITPDIELPSFDIKLTGLDAWWRDSGPVVEKKETATSITYLRRESISHPIFDGEVSIHFELNLREKTSPKSNFIAEESARFCFKYSILNSIDTLIDKFECLQGLMTVLLNHAHTLDWPILSVGRLYFKRYIPVETNITEYNCWTHFNWLKNNFGDVIDNWFNLYEKHGSSIQLFLSTKRYIPGVLETHFNNLVFSIESLHRSDFGSVKPEGKLSEKINRILDSVDKNDRRWLENKLKHAGEPSLSERVIAVLANTSFPIETSRLRKFSEEIAKFRNDLAHFGGNRNDQNYNTFIGRLRVLYHALSYMYHLVLLSRIGVDKDRLNWWAAKGFESFQIQNAFFLSGLIESDPMRISNTV